MLLFLLLLLFYQSFFHYTRLMKLKTDSVEINTWKTRNQRLLCLGQCWINSGHLLLLTQFLLFQSLLFQVLLHFLPRSYVWLQSNPKEQKPCIKTTRWAGGFWSILIIRLLEVLVMTYHLKANSSQMLLLPLFSSLKCPLKFHYKTTTLPSQWKDHNNGCSRYYSFTSYLCWDNHRQNNMQIWKAEYVFLKIDYFLWIVKDYSSDHAPCNISH